MADFSDTKLYQQGQIYPVHIQSASGLFSRCEPILTPQRLRSRYLKSLEQLPMFPSYSDEELKDEINVACNEIELLLKTPINREKFITKAPFDLNLYRSYIHIRTESKPILSIESLSIRSSNESSPGVQSQIYTIPAEWIETSNFSKGLINVVPMLSTFGAGHFGSAVASSGLAFLTHIGTMGWVPAFWQIEYSSGFSIKEGQVPITLNSLIGCQAALNILSGAGPINSNTSASLGQDGISQSTSNPGPMLYAQRIKDLQIKKDELLGQLQSVMQNKFLVGNL